jgi:6,7-dimethyl-8-ribityllumazine synthase
VDALVDGAKKALASCHVHNDNIHIHTVPGAYELPLAARALLANGDGKGNKYDAIICIGVLIKGGTMHL